MFEVKKQLRQRCDDGRNWSSGDTAVTVNAGSHGTTVLWCTWGVPQTNISGIHNGLEGWEALKWGYGVRIIMVPLTEMAVDRIFGASKARFWYSGFEVTLPRWLLMCPLGLVSVGTSAVPIDQDQVGLTATADYVLNGGRQGGGVNWRWCVCFLTSRIYANESILFPPYTFKVVLN